MCAMFGGLRDVSLIRKLNRELMGNIITQQASFYKYKLQETKVNLYGEAAGVKYYDGPFLFNCLIDRTPQSYPTSDIGVEFLQTISFEEIQKIKALEELPSTLENARKWMLVGLYLGQRVSDLLDLKPSQLRFIENGVYIDINQQKKLDAQHIFWQNQHY